jgi:glycosyltransferase involved in cell wall biosynthesis
LRVLMIAPTSFFSDYGGHIRILEEMRVLQARGVTVAVVTYYKGKDVSGLDIRRTAPLPWRTDYEVGSSRHKIAFDLYLAAKSLVEARRFRPNIIHGHMHEGALIGGLLARLWRVPLVFDYQGSLTAEMVDHRFLDSNGRLFSLVHRLETFITRRLPDAVLTSSGLAAGLLQDEFHVPTKRVHTLADCADPIHFDPARFPWLPGDHPLRLQLGISPDTTIVGYLGLLTDYQGLPQLIETAAILKAQGERVHFLVMGYPNVDKYEGQARRRGLEDVMSFTGRVPFDRAPYFLAACDVAVAPKVSTSEGSGKLLNYMAMALPTVAYDTTVNHEYLGEEGIYVPLGDVPAFASAVARLAHDPERRALVGERLRRRAIDEFNWSVAGDAILALYQRLTNP